MSALTWPIGRTRLGRQPLSLVRILRGLAGALVLAALWAGFAPQQLGGRSAFVMVDGTSMLPKYHGGDLVIVRRQSSYHVGEVVAYRNSQLGVTVMHRIVAMHGARYTFKGDNNTWQDGDHPTVSQLVGAEVVHVPGAGRYFQEMRRPVPMLILLALAGLVAYSGQPTPNRRHSRHGRTRR